MARCRLDMAWNLVMVCAHTITAAAVQEIALAGMVYGWMSTRKQTLASCNNEQNVMLRRRHSTSGQGKQQTHLAKQNCAVQKVQKQRITELEQHDSMQDAHISCTRVPGNISQKKN